MIFWQLQKVISVLAILYINHLLHVHSMNNTYRFCNCFTLSYVYSDYVYWNVMSTESGNNNYVFILYVFFVCLCLGFWFFLFFVCFFYFSHSMWKFSGKGLNPSHSSDNTESLTARPPGNSSMSLFLNVIYLVIHLYWILQV